MRRSFILTAASRRSRAAASLLVLLAGSRWVAAEPWNDEGTIQLREAPGRELTMARCITCHSLDYIPMNAPVMDSGAWRKTIQKMRDRFGAPLTDAEASAVLAYLSSSYSAPR